MKNIFFLFKFIFFKNINFQYFFLKFKTIIITKQLIKHLHNFIIKSKLNITIFIPQLYTLPQTHFFPYTTSHFTNYNISF